MDLLDDISSIGPDSVYGDFELQPVGIMLDIADWTEVGTRAANPLFTLDMQWTVIAASAGTPEAPSQRKIDLEFEQEKASFIVLLPKLKHSKFAGKFVAIHDGQVVDSDPSSAALVRRFFGRFGDQSVYIGYVGGRRVIRNISPRSIRRNS